MSEHEGFCVPLVEAMICDTPILAYKCSAIPHTLGSAEIQFEKKNYPELAAVSQQLREDQLAFAIRSWKASESN